jgi:hypothetical protein
LGQGKEELLKELLKFRSSGKLILHLDDIPAGIKLPSQWAPVISKPFGSFKVDFWPVLDAWIGIFFEDADLN